jgi:hypothetical protein
MPALIINIVLTLLLIFLCIKSAIKTKAIIKKEKEDEAKKADVGKANTSVAAIAPAPEDKKTEVELV